MSRGWTLAEGWDPRPLRGEVALVTGTLGGLGRAIADGIAAAGAKVAVHHLRQPDEAAAYADELRAGGIEATVVEADLTDWHEVERMLAAIADDLGPVSLLVNNAGMMRKKAFAESTFAEWRETIEIDLDAVFTVTRLALPAMLEAGRGTVVNVSSQLAFKGAHDYVSYSAAKGGVVGLTRALAREVGPGIRVNAIAPGPIETPMTAEYSTPEWVAERTAGAVLQRLGTPDEVVGAVVFLASPAASLIHGQVIHLNGGGVMA
ncbi:SDR family oxidoreductase [Microbacterium limosum]|uniref:SDR family oxidoreductase n=1 Tax=Microbacterium limosum TaxID=3079935 RepID=A0AAU0MIT1_9MICO|nr:SDR family oxidoreductase [Microbacterium sp. Y20]WOQ70059.1 SDR family oxidoreductase [Microbacterium sp. Y20]